MQNKNSSSQRFLILFFLIAFVFSWLFWIPMTLASSGLFSLPIPNTVFVIVGAHGPLFAALLLTHKAGRWSAVKELLRSGFNIRMAWGWWLAILLVPLIFNGLAVWANVIWNDFQPDLSLLSQPVLILPTYLVMFFLGGSFQEEFGWRGYALPRLLEKSNPLVASLILGILWGFWHLPLFYIAGTSQVYMTFIVFMIFVIVSSILNTWVFLRTNRNLFSVLLLHTAVNTSLSIFPPIEQRIGGNQMAFTYLTIAYTCFVLVLIAKDLPFWKAKATVN